MHVDFPDPMLPSMDTLKGRLLARRAAVPTVLIFDMIQQFYLRF